ncbi:GGDEF domain-containing protein [Clostridiaceae bacterium M8S5]|nr:GGDEF domain-containing protein [Clostridiaceae bacterium M8S5]
MNIILMQLDINIFVVVLLTIAYFYFNKNKRFDYTSVEHRLMVLFLTLNILIVLLGSLSYLCDTHFITNDVLCMTIYSIYYAFFWLPFYVCAMFIDYQIHSNLNRNSKLRHVLYIFIIINSILIVINIYTNIIFSYTDNSFIKGYFYSCYVIANYSILFIAFMEIIYKRKNMFSLLSVVLPPMICIISQVIYDNQSIIWISMAISNFLILFGFQEKNITFDYLTNAFNRRHLDSYLKNKIKTITPSSTFTGFMVDVDNFKHINDHYGHTRGDEALIAIVKIMRKSFKPNDFIARYAGDEFVIISEIDSHYDAQNAINMIKYELSIYNDTTNKDSNPLSVSIGYELYTYETKQEANQFIKCIDSKMYHNKKLKKRLYK